MCPLALPPPPRGKGRLLWLGPRRAKRHCLHAAGISLPVALAPDPKVSRPEVGLPSPEALLDTFVLRQPVEEEEEKA